MPRDVNPYVKYLRSAGQLCDSATRNIQFVINMDYRPTGTHPRSHNLLVANGLQEISVLIDEEPRN